MLHNRSHHAVAVAAVPGETSQIRAGTSSDSEGAFAYPHELECRARVADRQGPTRSSAATETASWSSGTSNSTTDGVSVGIDDCVDPHPKRGCPRRRRRLSQGTLGEHCCRWT